MASHPARTMLSLTRPSVAATRTALQTRSVAMAAATQPPAKKEGDISDAFVSLSGTDRKPLPQRYLDLKRQLVSGREDQVIDSWNRLLQRLRIEKEIVKHEGSGVVPSLDFRNLHSDVALLRSELKKRGVAVIRNVIPQDEARAFKSEIEEYVRQNPSTRAFPPDDPQVFELYWSAPQLKARSHPNLLEASKALMGLWHKSDPASEISLSQPLSYADRLRIRQPGDAKFALGPHIDGGSVERWELHGYGLGGVYDKIFEGKWEQYDPWDASTRVPAVSNNYNGLGACTMFRMLQGWLSMSHAKAWKGTLMVNPLVQLSTPYMLLRPFFRPIKGPDELRGEEYLGADNWEFCGPDMTSELHGATPGHGQELTAALHPHLELERTMVHVPDVKPGDFVAWHCDTIHAVDKLHSGSSDSSVLYIPICPVTQINGEYLARQRQAFLEGKPGPDFPGGKGESHHISRPTEAYLRSVADENGLRAFGFAKLVPADDDSEGSRKVTEKANVSLGFDH